MKEVYRFVEKNFEHFLMPRAKSLRDKIVKKKNKKSKKKKKKKHVLLFIRNCDSCNKFHNFDPKNSLSHYEKKEKQKEERWIGPEKMVSNKMQ